MTCQNLGALRYASGDDADAARLYRRALAIKERLLGRGHPDTAITVANLAALRRSRPSTIATRKNLLRLEAM